MFNTQIFEFNTDSGSVLLCSISILTLFQVLCLLHVLGETEVGRDTKIPIVSQNCFQQYNIFLNALSAIELNQLCDDNSINLGHKKAKIIIIYSEERVRKHLKERIRMEGPDMLKVTSIKTYEQYRRLQRFIQRRREVLKLLGNKAMHLKNAKETVFTLLATFLFRNKNLIISYKILKNLYQL